MPFSALLALPLSLTAQFTPAPPPAKSRPVLPRTAQPIPPKSPAQEAADIQAARQALQDALNAVHTAWFQPYLDINAVDLRGTLIIDVSAAALNAKAEELTQGQAKPALTKGGTAKLDVTGTYFANGDFRTETSGDFNLLYYRVGTRGFLYHKDQNTYTTRMDPPPTAAPAAFFGWFRQVLNDIQTVYSEGKTFKASLGKEETSGGRTLQTVIFTAPTAAYDPKKREQSLAETLGFWQRGRMEMTFDKTKHLPVSINFRNEAQGIQTHMTFAYADQDRLARVSFDNRSRGMEGPGFLQIAYGPDGLMKQVTGELTGKNKKVAFNFSLAWFKGRKTSSIQTVPPPGATKRSREELETGLLVKLASQLLELQRAGLNLRSVPLGKK